LAPKRPWTAAITSVVMSFARKLPPIGGEAGTLFGRMSRALPEGLFRLRALISAKISHISTGGMLVKPLRLRQEGVAEKMPAECG
jgi:hypothetical protein